MIKAEIDKLVKLLKRGNCPDGFYRIPDAKGRRLIRELYNYKFAEELKENMDTTS